MNIKRNTKSASVSTKKISKGAVQGMWNTAEKSVLNRRLHPPIPDTTIRNPGETGTTNLTFPVIGHRPRHPDSTQSFRLTRPLTYLHFQQGLRLVLKYYLMLCKLVKKLCIATQTANFQTATVGNANPLTV